MDYIPPDRDIFTGGGGGVHTPLIPDKEGCKGDANFNIKSIISIWKAISCH
jgi:hypothetical protein